jgi:hypothetical protein
MDESIKELGIMLDSAGGSSNKHKGIKLKNSLEVVEKIKKYTLVGKIVADRMINKNKIAMITQKPWASNN